MTSQAKSIPTAVLVQRANNTRPNHIREYRVLLYAISLAMDCLALVAGFAIASQIRDAQWLSAGSVSLATLAVPVFAMFSIAREAQSVETLEDRSLGIRRVFGALLATAIALMMITFVVKLEEVSRLGFVFAFGASAVFLVISRILLNIAFWKR